MANLIFDTRLGDQAAFYVWAGVTGPQWGGWSAFGAATPTRAVFPEDDWQRAISAAMAEADRLRIPTVYVARNG